MPEAKLFNDPRVASAELHRNAPSLQFPVLLGNTGVVTLWRISRFIPFIAQGYSPYAPDPLPRLFSTRLQILHLVQHMGCCTFASHWRFLSGEDRGLRLPGAHILQHVEYRDLLPGTTFLGALSGTPFL